MRLMALDIGEVRVGVAISDPSQGIATPLKILSLSDVVQNSKVFKALIEDWEPAKFVVGLPKSMDGKENSQAAKIREIAGIIRDNTEIEVEFFDERLSSSEAKNYMREVGLSERDMRGRVDALAASIILQTFLDSCR